MSLEGRRSWFESRKSGFVHALVVMLGEWERCTAQDVEGTVLDTICSILLNAPN